MLNSLKGDRTLIKQMNQRLVLQLIQGRGPISRRDITKISGLSAASISGITNSLMELGLIYEVGEADESGRAGRKAVLLRLNPQAGLVVGVKLARHSILAVLTDLDANVLHETELLLPSDDPSAAPYNPDATIQATIQTITDLLAVSKIEPTRLLGIGIGTNGTVDAESGISYMAPHFGWHNVSVTEPISTHFGIPVYLENDSNTLTIAEQWFGAGREATNFVAVAIGYGIGSGIVINKQLYRGASNGAGEFGHIILQKDGPLCSCGKHGCLEALASIPAIFRMLEESLRAGETSVLAGVKPLTIENVAHAAKKGDPLTLRILDTAGRWLGLGIASFVNILNPEIIVINGEAVILGSSYLGPMEAALREHVFDGLADSLRIISESGGNEIWARGAACVVLNSLFTFPGDQQGVQFALPTEIYEPIKLKGVA